MDSAVIDTINDYVNDLETNYIFFFASLVASNINAFYTRFNNRNYMSLDGIINDSKEYYLKDDKEKNLLYYLIDEALKEKYHLKIKDKEKGRENRWLTTKKVITRSILTGIQVIWQKPESKFLMT